MKLTAGIVFVYGLIILIGGLIGHYQAGSKASLICGLVFGMLMLICAWGILKGKSSIYFVALILTLILDGVFTYRFAKTLHFFPAGFMSLVSLAVLIIIALEIRKKQKLS
jgi:uncharacterized membrane protein (UPF0136 family)